ncbi:MAG: hypothetical protein AAFV07_04035, partial [Bacteroidota bacterium]
MNSQNRIKSQPVLRSLLRVGNIPYLLGAGVLMLSMFWGLQGIEEVQEATLVFTDASGSGPTLAGTDLQIKTFSDGGFAWGDINGDGCLDLVVNTSSKSPGTRVLISDCDANNPVFNDETVTRCSGCFDKNRIDNVERTVLLTDLNNDGYVDMVANGNALVEVYRNSGPPNYQFGSPILSISG